MKTLKTIKAVSAAILFTAGLASAQTAGTPGNAVFDEDGAIPITFSVEVAPTAAIIVHDNGLNQESADLFKTNVVVGGTGATAPMVAGKITIETNLAGWDVWINSVNGGKLVNGEATGVALGCGSPATPAVLNVYSCLTNNASLAACPATATAPSTGRRQIPLAGTTGGVDISMSQYMNAATVGATNGAKFSGAQAMGGNATMLIEANIPCLKTNLAPSETADVNEANEIKYTENLNFTLTSNW